MSVQRQKVDFGFCEEKFPAGTHMCLIFSNEEERARVIAGYLQSGISQGEKVAYFANERSPDEVRSWLWDSGVRNLPESGSLNFSAASAESTYYPHGHFAPEEMLANLKIFYQQARHEDFPGARVTGEMDWALKGIPGSERLMEYESRVNTLLVDHPVNAICQYDARKFDGATILECLKVHPYMVVRGQIVQNPFFLSPEEYLAQKV